MKILNKNNIFILIIAIGMLFILAIVFSIELYSDDFFYITFLNNGISSFIETNINHYQTVNGRVLVHIIDEIVLKLGKWFYMIILPIMLLYIFYSSAKTLLKEASLSSKENILLSIAFSLSIFMYIDVYVLKETAFWITGAFNYIFPLAMSISALLIIQKILSKNKFNILDLILLFLASFTTEQGFVMTLLFTIGTIILYNIKNKIIINKIEIIPVLVEIIGFISILLSPASRYRVSYTKTIFNYPILKLLEENFSKFALTIIGENSIAIIISILILLIALLSIKNKFLNKILIVGIPISLATSIIYFFKLYNEITSSIIVVIIMLYITLSIICLFKSSNHKNIALFLLVAFLVQGVTFSLGEISYRTLLPLTLLCILCSGNILVILLNQYNKISLITLITIFTIGIFNMIPTYKGYYNNKSVIDDMKESIKNYAQSGYIEINTNINKRYAHSMGYENADFLDYFYEYYGIKDFVDDIYYNTNGKESILLINNIRTRYSAYFKDDNIYLPIRYVMEALGGFCNWETNISTYTYKNHYTTIDNITNVIIDSSNPKYIGVSLKDNIINYLGRSYININSIFYIIQDNNCDISIGDKKYAIRGRIIFPSS